MEYSNTYIDDGDMPQLDEASPASGVSSQYMHHENSDLGPGAARQHPVVDEDELLAAQEAADAAVAQQQQHGTPGGVFNNVGQGLAGKNRDLMMQYWQETINSIEHDDHDFKNHQLPLARIKKVMKTDEDVRMISAEAPILFAKGCDVFITELTMRAWIHAEENKRRTLQKSDIAAALTKSDMFDFLIDVVPRDEEKPKKSYPSRTDAFAHSGPLNMLHGQQMHVPQMRAENGTGVGGGVGTGIAHMSAPVHVPQRPSNVLQDRHNGGAQSGVPSIPSGNAQHGPGESRQSSGPGTAGIGHSSGLLGAGDQASDTTRRFPESPQDQLKEGGERLETGESPKEDGKGDGAYYDNYAQYENNF